MVVQVKLSVYLTNIYPVISLKKENSTLHENFSLIFGNEPKSQRSKLNMMADPEYLNCLPLRINPLSATLNYFIPIDDLKYPFHPM
ncbi:MAG: hypothetical protein ACTSRB_14975 [Candidatus Helarchaeota archaeon]